MQIDAAFCNNKFQNELNNILRKNIILSDFELFTFEKEIRKCILINNVDEPYKSPVKRKHWIETTPFDYERALPPERLEKKYMNQMKYMPRFITCYRSGMSAIYASISVISSLWRNMTKINVGVLAYYFETKSIFEAYVDKQHFIVNYFLSPDDLYNAVETNMDVDCLFVEMMDVNLKQENTQLELIRAALLNRKSKKPLIIIIDNTLVFDSFDVETLLKDCFTNIVIIVVRSCLKLDQFGLELSNLGVIEFYCKDDSLDYINIKKMFCSFRALTGLSITYSDEKILLSDIFIQKEIFEYSKTIKQNTEKLFMKIRGSTRTNIKEILYKQGAPFILISLNKKELHEYEAFVQDVVMYVEKKTGYIVQGTSFGFRHTRIETIMYSKDNYGIRISPGYYWGVTSDLLIEYLMKAEGEHDEKIKKNNQSR